MTDGLITRIGKWADRKWMTNAKEIEVDQLRDELRQRWNDLENSQIKDKLELRKDLEQLKFDLTQAIRITNEENEKDTAGIGDLKTRLEKIELYCGMTRRVDPTKPAVVKSAFSM